MIVGVTERIGAGKGEFCKTFIREGFVKLAFGDEVRYKLGGRKIAENREVLQRHGFELRDELADRIAAKVLGDNNYVIDGFRYPSQIRIVREYVGDFPVVAIDANEEYRFARLKRRNREGDPKTWEEFWVQDGRDWVGYFEETGQDVRGCFEIANHFVYNNETLDDFRRRSLELVGKLRNGFYFQ